MPRNPELTQWVGDFETTSDVDEKGCETARIWAWGLCNIYDTDEFVYGTDMQSFVDHLQKLHSHVYFHNLAFDGAYILDWLMRNGYKHTTERGGKPGEFSTLISHAGKFYSIVVYWKNGTRTEFRDSLKKLPMTVDAVSKAFNLEAVKGELDYDAPRPIGHVITGDELDYLRNDCVIVALALREQFNENMSKLTVGADALAEYKRLTGSKVFKRMYPVLDLLTDADIRKSYRGGWVYADPRFSRRVIGRGSVFDVNSLYPSVMYDRVLPYGEPIQVRGECPEPTDDYPLFIVSVTFTGRLKRNHLPCIQVKGSSIYTATEYQTVIKEPVTLFATNVDLALWHDHYDLDILSYNGGYLFRGVTGMFTEYIDKWSAIKANSEGGRKVIAKLHLNSLYGKFATNPDVTGKVPVMRDNVVRFERGPEESRDPVYTPMGSFITSYARDVTVRAAQRHYGVFAYADTDSLHLVGEGPFDLDVDPKRLGAWKHELDFEAAYFLRAKAYSERDFQGHYHTHVAGLPTHIASQATFADFESGGRHFSGKLAPKRVPGGVVLEDVGFKLA